MIFFELFIEFFKTGLFSIGGGYATIPFLYQISLNKGWYNLDELSNILAVSVITPGPVGVNMATYAGFKTAGFFGATLATLALVLPSFFLVIFIYKTLKRYENNFYTKSVLYALKPASFGMIFAVFVNLAIKNLTDISSFVIFISLFVITFFFKKNPSWYFLFAILIGFILNFLKFFV